MKLRSLVLVLALLAPSTVSADPISVGAIWSPTPTVPSGYRTGAPLPFWSGASWDGWHKGVNFLLEEYGATGLEYLNNGSGDYTSFRFDEDIFDLTKMGGITAWTGGVLGRRSDGAFTYDSGTGRISNSWDNAGQYALFRIVLPDVTHYFLGVEDILLTEARNDRDYNDYIVKFETHSVPEPGTLLLLGSGMAALAVRKKLAARKAHTEAAV